MSTKLNSMRLLEANDIPYEVLEYDTGIKDAESVAEMVGVPEFMVFKTLVAHAADNKHNDPVLALIPADTQLDLKALAKVCGEKKMKMASQSDAEKWTGLQVGGISPLMLMDKNWTIYLDSSAGELQNIVISAGKRGLQLRVPVNQLMQMIKPRLVDISRNG
jgi:Cys-tRNA(Pro)/Cys-tRNA(Cys) deacylase